MTFSYHFGFMVYYKVILAKRQPIVFSNLHQNRTFRLREKPKPGQHQVFKVRRRDVQFGEERIKPHAHTGGFFYINIKKQAEGMQ
ncbi:MAG TPA: hypothetical protein VFE53_17155 [Mucilaginibacter sp.]|jgi:hypothetical protein|nr:hypothetical protein [Mucilaginibacter sp.]